VSAGTARAAPRADAGALGVVADYKAARERGEYRRLKLAGADLRDSDMSGLKLDECDLTGAVLDGAHFIGSSLVRSSLAGASLLGADFSYADMDRADMEAADATAAAFVGASLTRANLIHARLQRADLSDADLSKANLFESNLTGANLSRALASQTSLHGAILEDAVLTGLRGDPLFDVGSDEPSSDKLFGWPAAKLTEPQLVELAESYLRMRGWGISELASSRDAGVDLMARRNDTWLVLEAKATATPSSLTFMHVAERLRRAADQDTNVLVILVIPGPVPASLLDLARTHRIGVLGVWVEPTGMRVEEVVRASADSLGTQA
jgi:uncharacterized protein YjbI with pentapeptide repeats